MLDSLDLQRIPNNKLQDAFRLIQLSTRYLEDLKLEHWSKYYKDFETYIDRILRNKSVVYINEKPAATLTLSKIPPQYFIKPEIKPKDESGNEVDNFLHFFTLVESEESVLYLSALAVRPDLQGQGIARKVIKKLKN